MTSYGLGGSRPVPRKKSWGWLVFAILLALASLSLATQRVAAHFGDHPALGAPLFRAGGMAWHAPWQVIVWQQTLPDADGFIDQSITLAQACFLFPLLGAVALSKRRSLSKGRPDLHGSARWATEDEIRGMGLMDGRGVYVGGWVQRRGRAETQLYLRHNGPEHVLCFAPTRSGKGVGLIIPTLLSWPDSAVIFDIKGENWTLTAGFRRELGQNVLRFDPSDASGASARFNPLEEIRLETHQAIPDAQNLAQMLMDPQGKGLEDYWAKAAFAFLGGAILHCLVMTRASEGRTGTLHGLAHLLADPERPIREVVEGMLALDHASVVPGDSGREIDLFVKAAARELLNKADKEFSGVVSTALATLALYRDPVVARNTSRCDFRIRDLMHHERPVSLYLVISPADIDRLRPLVRIVVTLLLNRSTATLETPPHRLLLMLDEFTALGRLDAVERAIAFMAGYRVKGYFIVQDITQLNAIYGKDNAIMANCHLRAAYAPNTIETARLLSEMTGKTTVVEERTSLSGARSGGLKTASVSVSETARPLLTEDECMRLPAARKDAAGQVVAPGDMLLFTAGRPPIYGRQILYFLDPVFAERAKTPAPATSDSLIKTRPEARHDDHADYCSRL